VIEWPIALIARDDEKISAHQLILDDRSRVCSGIGLEKYSISERSGFLHRSGKKP